ncbi:VP2 [Muko virus]|uniref:VP2 protein n=1 Tax=Muko virus TaxID=1597962 RepID=A0A0P0YL54_9REOV|nr:VP2 [Muko virus]
MEDFEILVKGPDRLKPLVQQEYTEFDVVVTPHTEDTAGPYHHSQNLPTRTSFEPPTSPLERPMSLAVPCAAGVGIQYTQGRITRQQAEERLSMHDEYCWMDWRPNQNGTYSAETALGQITMPGKSARTACSHFKSWCVERRCHTAAEVERFRDCMLLHILAIDEDKNIRVGPEGIPDARKKCYTMRGNVERITAPPYSRNWRRTLGRKYQVKIKRPDHCEISVATENAVRALLLELIQVIYNYLPPEHRLRHHEFEREISKRLDWVPREMIRGHGCLVVRAHNVLADVIGCRKIAEGPKARAIAQTREWIISTPIFQHARLAEENDDAMLRYVALHLLLSCVPGLSFKDTVIPLAECLESPHRQERRTKTLGVLCDLTLREWLALKPHCPQHGSPASGGMLGNLRLLIGRVEGQPDTFAFNATTLQPVENLGRTHALLGGLCMGLREIVSCVVPYRAPRKSFMCVILCESDLDDPGIDDVVRTRTAGADDSCIGVAVLRLHSDGIRVRTTGSIRSIVEDYVWCMTSGTSIILKPRSATRECADFMTKVLRFRD